jgi:signal peptidase II
MRSALLAALALAVIAVDDMTKAAVANTCIPSPPGGPCHIVINHILYITYVQNYRGAFGFFGTHPLLLSAAASAVLIGFYLWYRKEGAAAQVHIAFALIFGGAVGNIADRLRFGYVHDFIDFRVWPVFNVADSAITIGVGLLLLQMLVREKGHDAVPIPGAPSQPHEEPPAIPYAAPAEE